MCFIKFSPLWAATPIILGTTCPVNGSFQPITALQISSFCKNTAESLELQTVLSEVGKLTLDTLAQTVLIPGGQIAITLKDTTNDTASEVSVQIIGGSTSRAPGFNFLGHREEEKEGASIEKQHVLEEERRRQVEEASNEWCDRMLTFWRLPGKSHFRFTDSLNPLSSCIA